MEAYRTRKEDEGFRERWDAAIAVALDELEEAAVRRAKRESDTLLIFLLKSHRPERYRETTRNEVTGKDGSDLRITVQYADTGINDYPAEAASGAGEGPAGM